METNSNSTLVSTKYPIALRCKDKWILPASIRLFTIIDYRDITKLLQYPDKINQLLDNLIRGCSNCTIFMEQTNQNCLPRLSAMVFKRSFEGDWQWIDNISTNWESLQNAKSIQ